jgi:hypothetical protein
VRFIGKQKEILTLQKQVAWELLLVNSFARLCFWCTIMLPQAQFCLGHHPKQTCQSSVLALLYFMHNNNNNNNTNSVEVHHAQKERYYVSLSWL